MKRFTRYLRSRWICLPTWAKILLVISVALSVLLTIKAPHLWWSIVDRLLIVVLVAEVNYLNLRRQFNKPVVEFAEKISRLMLNHDEIIIYRTHGEYRFIGITNDDKKEEANAPH